MRQESYKIQLGNNYICSGHLAYGGCCPQTPAVIKLLLLLLIYSIAHATHFKIYRKHGKNPIDVTIPFTHDVWLLGAAAPRPLLSCNCYLFFIAHANHFKIYRKHGKNPIDVTILFTHEVWLLGAAAP